MMGGYILNVIPFPSFPSENPYPFSPPPAHQPSTPASCSWHSPILGHITFTGPRDSPLTHDLQGHPLLNMQLEPWVPPCVLFGWWFGPWELWGYWLVHIVVPPMGLQIPSAPWVLSLAPSLGTQSHGWMWESTSVFVRHWQSLSGDRYIRLLSASTWHPQKCLGLVILYGMDPQVGQYLDGLSFSPCSTLCLCNSFHGCFVSPS